MKNQLQKDLKGIENGKLKIGKLLIAYEPIWAIGTGKNASSDDARDMAIFIKKTVFSLSATCHLPPATPVLYGGSVTSKNIGDYVQCKEIDPAWPSWKPTWIR